MVNAPATKRIVVIDCQFVAEFFKVLLFDVFEKLANNVHGVGF